MTEWPVILLVGFAVVFIGLSKAGFGGGLGMLTTPLCVVAFGMAGQSPQFAVGFLLPLLCAGDSFSLYHYWRQWRLENLKYLLPGVVLGVIVGIQLMDRMEPRHFSLIIGVLAVSFVVFQLVKERGDWVKNDHVAFRSFNAISLLKVFLPLGYFVQFDTEDRVPMNFKQKHLTAVWLKHPNLDLPRVFISECRLPELPQEIKDTLGFHYKK